MHSYLEAWTCLCHVRKNMDQIGVKKLFHPQLNWAWNFKTKMLKNKNMFLALKLSNVVFSLLINVKMPLINQVIPSPSLISWMNSETVTLIDYGISCYLGMHVCMEEGHTDEGTYKLNQVSPLNFFRWGIMNITLFTLNIQKHRQILRSSLVWVFTFLSFYYLVHFSSGR